ncbi:uncharacterized protein LOC109366370 [Meleagris gallopavo]|uniref:uncharacterized protein LOC109366370 n=1 Tax=Meleagris gallopavo TaxID=9103 RepID=UPI0012AB68C4|nr:uncharacterized protein LOC109366370 [Meleagris gallopavo]
MAKEHQLTTGDSVKWLGCLCSPLSGADRVLTGAGNGGHGGCKWWHRSQVLRGRLAGTGAPCAGHVAPSSKDHDGRAVPSCHISSSQERSGLWCCAVYGHLFTWTLPLVPRALQGTRQASQTGPAPAGSGGTRGPPRTLSQRPRLDGGVKDLPPEISNFTKPPVKGLIFQEGLVQREERKRWWDYKTKRLFWHMLSPALPKGHKKPGAAARPALHLQKKADGKTEACQPFNSGFSDKRSTEKSDMLAMEGLYRQLLPSLKQSKTNNNCYKSGSGTEEQPTDTSFCTLPPVKGMNARENILQTEAGKCWWKSKAKRPSEYCIASPALSRV